MNRLRRLFEPTQDAPKLLSVFVTAGYPRLHSTTDLVWTLEDAGADFMEIGVPFSDPIADGPIIQKSSQIALRNGVNLDLVFEQILAIRKRSQIPLILMSYLNPLLAYGMERLVRDAVETGIDGLIIPDLIPEEFARFGSAFAGAGIGCNFLISPNTTTERIRIIDELTHDFVYCVSVAGTTGVRKGVAPGLVSFLRSTEGVVGHPLFVGFGISNPVDARTIAHCCAGVVVGSALINLLRENGDKTERFVGVTRFVRELKSALKGA